MIATGFTGRLQMGSNGGITIAQIQDLLDRVSRARVKDIFKFMSIAGRHVTRIMDGNLSWRDPNALAFNIFSITRRGHYEVTTHSRLLAHLLDPDGTHDQGNLFLSAFLHLVISKKPGWHFPPADRKWRIFAEHENVDIVLKYPNPETVIIIENKWSAPDRENQLLDYWKQQHKTTGRRLQSIPAIYLTPTGREPLLLVDPNPDRRFCDDLVRLSYAVDIRGLLTAALKEIRAARVSTTLEQYLDLMESFDEDR